MPFAATWMDLEMTRLSKVNQKEKERESYGITYMRNLKCDAKEFIYETETDSQTENRPVVAEGW